MPCGKRLPNHASNTRRHKMTCQRCCAITGSPSTLNGQTSLESPTRLSAGVAETPYFYPTYDTSLGDLNDVIYLNEDYPFGLL
ncbi:hypothetical protein CLIM01_11653 [Colletotrichum limetticola]|uniref:Uncharacterized protein n=1 Tax=Colletotrichum limetticola TaxID=1209924 RepID=A0ABQ9PG26_9PEZI|nr:hypothetical protein CLIM01_11653 [Colletotrichum limetticola]